MKANTYTLKKALTSLVLIISTGIFAQTGTKPLIRLFMDGTGSNDETVFYFETGGTTSFQSDMDAYKLLYGNHPYIASLSDSVLTAISGLPALPVNLSIPVKAISPTTATFTFSSEFTDFPLNVCVRLYDRFTGISTDIRNNSYTCTIYDTTSIARFNLNVSSGQLNVLTQATQPTCTSPFGGMKISVNATGECSYTWKKDSVTIKSCSNKTGLDSISGLFAGVYQVFVEVTGQCESFTTTFTVNPVLTSFASFSTTTIQTSLSKTEEIHFTNTSSNAQFSIWNFGDNSGSWYVPSPSHSFKSAGIYTVSLVTQSADHCTDTASVEIAVIDDVTGMSELQNNDAVKLCTISQGHYELRFAFNQSENLQISLYDIKGSLLKNEALENVNRTVYPIALGSEGIYLLKVKGEAQERTFKLMR
ncbi:MAG: T9SS type A sorting domain-containing protein [Bacteroidia bacterium]|nr:T9SS type A sorting domain-containing protein [Bacteroidia bacterium]